MSDPRLYRTALVPVLLALVLLAFSLENRPRALTTTVAPDAFTGERAFDRAYGPGGLADRFPERRPGSAGDERLATAVARDHFAVGEAAMCAVYPDGRNEFAHPELLRDEDLAPHAVAETWVMAPMGDGDHAVDITDVFDRKMAALRAHVSQTAHLDDLETRMRAWGAAQAMGGKLGAGRLAESFHVLDTR